MLSAGHTRPDGTTRCTIVFEFKRRNPIEIGAAIEQQQFGLFKYIHQIQRVEYIAVADDI